jgi:hypothetical protein
MQTALRISSATATLSLMRVGARMAQEWERSHLRKLRSFAEVAFQQPDRQQSTFDPLFVAPVAGRRRLPIVVLGTPDYSWFTESFDTPNRYFSNVKVT